MQKEKKKWKRVLSIVLAMVVIICSLNLNVFTTQTKATEIVSENSSTISGDDLEEQVPAEPESPSENLIPQDDITSDELSDNTVEPVEVTEEPPVEATEGILPMTGSFMEVDTYEKLKALLEAPYDTNVKLTADITIPYNSECESQDKLWAILITGGNHVLDLNGHTITMETSYREGMFRIYGGAFEICDSSADKTGECIYNGLFYLIYADIGSFTLKSGKLKRAGQYCYGIVGQTIYQGHYDEQDQGKVAPIHIYGGEVYNESNHAIHVQDEVKISGGIIKSDGASPLYIKREANATPNIYLCSGTFLAPKGINVIETVYAQGVLDEYKKNIIDYIPGYCDVTWNGNSYRDMTPGVDVPACTTGPCTFVITPQKKPGYDVGTVSYNISSDVYGKTANEIISALNTSTDYRIKTMQISSISNDGMETPINTTDTLSDDNDYELQFQLEAIGKYFPDPEWISIEVNNERISEFTIDEYGYLYFTYVLSTPYRIKDMDIEVVPPSVGDEFPQDVHILGGGNYSLVSDSLHWDTNDQYAKAGQEYSVSFTLEADQNYFFEEPNKMNCYINNNALSRPAEYKMQYYVDKNNTEDVYKLQVSMTFETKEKKSITVSGGKAYNRNGDEIDSAFPNEYVELRADAPPSGKYFQKWSKKGEEKLLFKDPLGSDIPQEQLETMPYVAILMGATNLEIDAVYGDHTSTSEIYSYSINNYNLRSGTNYEVFGGSACTTTNCSISAVTMYRYPITGVANETDNTMTTSNQFESSYTYVADVTVVPSGGMKFKIDNGHLKAVGTMNGRIVKPSEYTEDSITFRVPLGGATYGITADGCTISNTAGEDITYAQAGDILTVKTPTKKAGVPFTGWRIYYKDVVDSNLKSYFNNKGEYFEILEDGNVLTDTALTFIMDNKDMRFDATYIDTSTMISKINMTVSDPEIGEIVLRNNLRIESDGATDVSISAYHWSSYPFGKYNGFATDSVDVVFDSKYESFKGYLVAFELTPTYGKQFANKAEVYINGKSCDFVISPDGNKLTGVCAVKELVPDGIYISDIADMTYTGKAQKPSVTVYESGRLLTAGKDYSLSYKNNINAAAADSKKAPTVIVNTKNNYKGSATKTFTILPRSMTDSQIQAKNLIVVTRKDRKQVFAKPVIKYGNKKLSAKDYNVEYVDQSDIDKFATPGTYDIKITGKKNFTGNITIHQIMSSGLISKVNVAKIANQNYTGDKICPSPVVKYGKTKLVKGKDYTLSYKNNIDVGVGEIVITGVDKTGTEGGYIGTKTVKFKIVGKTLKSKNVTMLTKSKIYMNKVINLYPGTDYQIQNDNKVTLERGKDFKVSYKDNSKVGTATVIFTGVGRYTGTVKKTFKITAFDVGTKEIGTEGDMNYTKGDFAITGMPQIQYYEKGGIYSQNAVLTYRGKSLQEKKDYTVSYKNTSKVTVDKDGKPIPNAKLPVIIYKLKGNYTGKITKGFIIKQKELKSDNDKLKCVVAEKKYIDKDNNYKTSMKLSDENGKKMVADVDYDLKNAVYEYHDGTAYKLMDSCDTFKNNRLVLSDTQNDARMRITVAGKGSYYGSYSKEYRVYKNDIKNASIGKISPQIYTGKEICPAVSVTYGKEKTPLIEGTDYEVTYQKNVNKGTAKVIIRGIDAYGGSKTATFTIKYKSTKWWEKLFGI